MTLIRLTAEHAEAIDAAARQVYPETLLLSIEELRSLLRGIEEDGANLSFGVLESGKLVGYLLAWIEPSRVEGRERQLVALVEDVVVLPGAHRRLIRLLEALGEAARTHPRGPFPIEGAVRQAAEHVFTTHPEAIASVGYVLREVAEYHDEEIGESFLWVRFEPLEETPGIEETFIPSAP